MNRWEARGSGSWSCGGRFGSSTQEKQKMHVVKMLVFFFFTTTSCCSPWSPASCPSLCRWMSCGSCVWTRARVPHSPSRLSHSRWRPRPCRPSCDPSGLRTKTQIRTLRWGMTCPQICPRAADWKHQHCAGHRQRRSQSSTPSDRLPGTHFSPQPLSLAHRCCC